MPRETIGPRERVDRLPRIEESAGENKEDFPPSIYCYMFPGQGSKIPEGMGQGLYDGSLAARDVILQADQSLQFPLSKLILNGLQEEDLMDTSKLQPVIFTLNMATLAALKEQLGDRMPNPEFVAGHSAAQLGASVASGAVSLNDGFRLARERGRLMKKASQESPGTMAAILSLDPYALEHICAETGVEIANLNTDDQVVISGDRLAVTRAADLALLRGARKAVLLPVSGAWHSSFMKNAQAGFQKAISQIEFSDPKYPIVGNTTAGIITKAEAVKKELVIGMCMPVLWRDSVVEMTRRGVNRFIELGPNRILSGLVKEINKDVDVFPVNSFKATIDFADLLSQQPANRNPLSA